MGRSLLTSAVHGRNMSSLFRQKKRVDAEGQRNELCWSFCSPHQTQSAIFQTALCFALLPSDLQLGLSNCSQQWEMRRQEGRKFRVFIPHAPSLLGWRLLKAVFLCHSNSYVVCPKTTCRSLWVPGITPFSFEALTILDLSPKTNTYLKKLPAYLCHHCPWNSGVHSSFGISFYLWCTICIQGYIFLIKR